MRALRNSFLFFLTFTLIISCKREEKNTDINVKILNYKVNYISDKAGSIPTQILPNKMELVFGENYAMNRIEGFMGQFSLVYIANLKKRKVTTLLKIFDKKYYYSGQNKEFPCGIDPMINNKLIPTGKKMKILGFNADEFELYLSDNEKLKVYGTYDIAVKSPNSTTPYKSMDQVLLQFYTQLSVLKMYLVAENYEEKKLSSTIFDIPENYIEISRGQMENILTELFR